MIPLNSLSSASLSSPGHLFIDKVFLEIFPSMGMTVRSTQIELSHQMLDALYGRKIALCEAGVGIGKTYAYLVAAMAHHLFNPDDFMVRTSQTFYGGFSVRTPMPIIITTSSIELQKAIMNEFLPFLSKALVKAGIIKDTICSVVRKGKSHFICEDNLERHISMINSQHKNKKQMAQLLSLLDGSPDLDPITGISSFDRRAIQVNNRCSKICKHHLICRYQNYIREACSPQITFQICNHNYFLADLLQRKQGNKPLLPNHRAVIMDEAHLLVQAGEQMYGCEVVQNDFRMIVRLLAGVSKHDDELKEIVKSLKEAADELFAGLKSHAEKDGQEDQSRFVWQPTGTNHDLVVRLLFYLKSAEKITTKLKLSIITRSVKMIKDRLSQFKDMDPNKIYFVEQTPSCMIRLAAVPKTLREYLWNDLWNRYMPYILTSGTLSVNGNFERTRNQLGIRKESIMINVRETCASSPFDYLKNCLLYLPKQMAHPDHDEIYLEQITQHVKDLILTSNGHTLVLFTSYRLKNEICGRIMASGLPYIILNTLRNARQTVSEFKMKRNAVLFATGSCWEGVDFPGDLVSSLIIVTLPFSVPDPIRDYERHSYPSLQDFIRFSVVPDMQKKLNQGFGRAIRTELDTCVVSILDERANKTGRYHSDVIKALPPCPITEQLADVRQFLMNVKTSAYWQNEILPAITRA